MKLVLVKTGNGEWDSLFTFIYHEGVESTNNLAERALRPAVQSRKISYCTRSANGQFLRARLLTVWQTCRIQHRNPLEFFRLTIHAHRNNLTLPSLLAPQKDPFSSLIA
ncbi:MAG TPA: transposase [Candidatus Brocadiaceae bacterium]|nr:transposase [Candidatus Brocadiaceae bacterium]